MSVPSKNTIFGKVLYEGKTYGVLYGFHLSDEIWEKYEQYSEDKGCIWSTAPWATIKINWSIIEDKLYLTRFCREGLLTELMGSEKILADWVNKLALLVEHRRICKTYEKSGAYLNEMDTLHLSFNQGVFVDKQPETEIYTSIEMKKYIDRNRAYATLRIDSSDLFAYLENIIDIPQEDQIFPMMSNFIDQMLQKGGNDDILLGLEDIKTVLNEGDLAVFGSAKGSNIDEMVGSLVDSMTDEVLEAKGCLLHFTIHKDYPVAKIESIVNSFERKLGFDKVDPLDVYMPNRKPFIFGTKAHNELAEDEVLIRVLLGI